MSTIDDRRQRSAHTLRSLGVFVHGFTEQVDDLGETQLRVAINETADAARDAALALALLRRVWQLRLGAAGLRPDDVRATGLRPFALRECSDDELSAAAQLVSAEDVLAEYPGRERIADTRDRLSAFRRSIA
jgi:hypothetical protein